jgi:hypothetical protein
MAATTAGSPGTDHAAGSVTGRRFELRRTGESGRLVTGQLDGKCGAAALGRHLLDRSRRRNQRATEGRYRLKIPIHCTSRAIQQVAAESKAIPARRSEMRVSWPDSLWLPVSASRLRTHHAAVGTQATDRTLFPAPARNAINHRERLDFRAREFGTAILPPGYSLDDGERLVLVHVGATAHGSGPRLPGRRPRVVTLLRLMLPTDHGRRDAGRYVRASESKQTTSERLGGSLALPNRKRGCGALERADIPTHSMSQRTTGGAD